MSGFGSSDIVQDQSGNALANVKLNVYGTLADAKAQTNLLATVTTNSKGQWPVSVNGYDMVWVRDPAGNVWSAASDTVAGDHASRLSVLENATGSYELSAHASSTYQPVATFDSTQAGNINNGASATRGALNGAFGQLPAAADKVVFVTPRGNDANNGRSLATALATVSAGITALGGPGKIQLGYGTISYGSQINLDSTTNITIEGAGGMSGGGTTASVLTYTGTGTTPAISAQHSIGLTIRDVMLLYSSSSFTGRLVDARNGVPGTRGNDTNYLLIERCYLGSVGGAQTADCLLDLDGATQVRLRGCSFRDCVNGIRGQSASGSYANIVHVEDCYFRNATQAHIRNPGDGWVVEACTWEPLVSGAAGAVICDSGVATNGFTVVGGWAGDIVASAGGIQFDLTGNNLYIFGTTIGGNTGSTGVKIRNAASGVIIAASISGPTTGIDVSGITPTNYDFSKSNFISCATPLTSGFPRSSFETPGGVPALFLHNGGTVSGDATARFKADKTSVQQYDLGIDPGGGTTKAFQLRDLTASGAPIRFTVTPAGSFIAGVSAPATTATDGFVYIPVTAGTPTGVPTAQTGYVPMMADSTGSKLWVYIGGAWKSTTLA